MQNADCLYNSGKSSILRFQSTGDLADISEAISSFKKAVDLTTQEHDGLPRLLSDLGKALTARFELTGDANDILEAISHARRAVQLTPDGHTDLPGFLTNLGLSLMHHFENTGDLSDISEAISVQRKAISLIPDDHRDKPTLQDNLGNSLKRLFQRTNQLNDISDAVHAHQEAVQLSEKYGYPESSRFSKNMLDALQLCFEHSQELASIQVATISFRRFSTSQLGSPSKELRLNAKKWASFAKKVDSVELLQAWSNALRIASQVAGLEHTIQKRYTYLHDISELSVSAAAAALELGRPHLALEWLEQGRCLVWSQLNKFRTPLDVLQTCNPALADEFLKVSKALELAGSRSEPAAFPEEITTIQTPPRDEATSHVELAKQWDKLIERIRSIRGFESFFLPSTCSDLMRGLPERGLVVVINIHQDRSDALLLMLGRKIPIHVPLPDFSYEKADNFRISLHTYLRHIGVRDRGSESDHKDRGMRPAVQSEAKSVIKDVLSQLWKFLVKPILDKLELALPLAEKLRIWWCLTGPLAFLPVHAAGIHDDGHSTTLSDFAISSYIPSVSALIERVKRPREVDVSNMGLVMISQPDTPGQRPIPGASTEVQAIGRLLNTYNVRHLCLERNVATVEEGTKQMDAYSCIHFACHANQDTTEALKSAFHLYDGPLELSTIIKQNLARADLAFLAACQTSTGDEKLSEEAVHLAAGMLAAGYRGVVATMWSISDSVAPKIAEHFYSKLVADEETGFDGNAKGHRLSSDGAAHALHYATNEIRKELGDTDEGLLAWVPYVHYGL